MVFIFSFLYLPGNKGEKKHRSIQKEQDQAWVFNILSAFSTGASNAYSVVQTPPFIIKGPGESVTRGINCSHNITNYDVILWYKQDHRALKLLGYLNINFPYPEDDVKEKISFKGDGRKQSSLTISNVSVYDNGVYFCAAS